MKKKVLGLIAAFAMAVTPLSQFVPYIETPVYAASQKLSAPTTFAVKKVTSDSVSLKWSKVTGADAYRVYRYDSAKRKYISYKRVTGTSLKITGLSGSTTYKFKMCALVKNGKKYTAQTMSKIISATTDIAAPNKPNATSTDTSISLEWNRVEGAKAYMIYKYDNGLKEYRYYAQTLLTNYGIYHLDSDTEYSFKVCAAKAGVGRYIEGPLSEAVTLKTKTPPVKEDPYEGYDKINKDIYNAISPTPYGSAAHAVGSTLVLSIFIDDEKTSWDIKNADIDKVDRYWQNLRTTVRWIADWGYQYDKSVKFIYDFKEDPNLLYTAHVDTDLQKQENVYDAVCKVINKDIDSVELKSKYGVSNLLYMVYVNTSGGDAKSNAWAFDDPTKSYEYPYEFAVIYNHENFASVMAHFMLHIFGAPYLDRKGEFGITQEFVDNAEFTLLNDIMYIYHDRSTEMYSLYDITNEFSPLTAYFMGFTNYTYDVEKWNLDKSQHMS